jgi:hypothetical protein
MVIFTLFSTLAFLCFRNGLASTTYSLPSGHWKISNLTSAVFRCPFGDDACLGSSNPAFAGNQLCAPGFTGILCGLPTSNRYIDWVDRDTTECTDIVVGLSLGLTLASFVALLCAGCFCASRTGASASARTGTNNSRLRKAVLVSPHSTSSPCTKSGARGSRQKRETSESSQSQSPSPPTTTTTSWWDGKNRGSIPTSSASVELPETSAVARKDILGVETLFKFKILLFTMQV